MADNTEDVKRDEIHESLEQTTPPPDADENETMSVEISADAEPFVPPSAPFTTISDTKKLKPESSEVEKKRFSLPFNVPSWDSFRKNQRERIKSKSRRKGRSADRTEQHIPRDRGHSRSQSGSNKLERAKQVPSQAELLEQAAQRRIQPMADIMQPARQPRTLTERYYLDSDSGWRIAVDVFFKEGTRATAKKRVRGIRPVVVYCHGGGFLDLLAPFARLKGVKFAKQCVDQDRVCFNVYYSTTRIPLSLHSVLLWILTMIIFWPLLSSVLAPDAPPPFVLSIVIAIALNLGLLAYRESHPGAMYPEFVQDVASAVRWVHDNAELFGGNPEGIVLAGHGSGGYLASLVAMDPRWLGEAGVPRECVIGMFLISPVFDLMDVAGHPLVKYLLVQEQFKGTNFRDAPEFKKVFPSNYTDHNTDCSVYLINKKDEFRLCGTQYFQELGSRVVGPSRVVRDFQLGSHGERLLFSDVVPNLGNFQSLGPYLKNDVPFWQDVMIRVDRLRKV